MSSLTHHALWWIWEWCSTAFVRKWRIGWTEVIELESQSGWSKAMIWTGRNPRSSACINIVINGGRTTTARPIGAYKWYFCIWVWEVHAWQSSRASSSWKWRPASTQPNQGNRVILLWAWTLNGLTKDLLNRFFVPALWFEWRPVCSIYTHD